MTAQPFHPLDIPIHGTNLIEASAGTGKTWGIAALFTRLIVLEKMPVEQILVVTFTKAATAELKTRLRGRLDEALQALEILGSADEAAHAAADAEALAALYRLHSDDAPPDGFIFDLLHRALQNENLPRLTVRLKAAISQFDNAAIYTIHGFCQRLLRDYAFLCQAPFDTELAEHKRERLLTPAQDFWRTEVAADVHKARLVFKHRYTPENMLAEIQKYLSRPYLAFRRPEVDLAAAENGAVDVGDAGPMLDEEARDAYRRRLEEIEEVVEEAERFNDPERRARAERLCAIASPTLDRLRGAAATTGAAAIGAAGSLGANWVRTFLHVVLPLAKPGFIGAGLVVLTLSLTDFAIPAILGGGSQDLGLGSAGTLILTVVILAFGLVQNRLLSIGSDS